MKHVDSVKNPIFKGCKLIMLVSQVAHYDKIRQYMKPMFQTLDEVHCRSIKLFPNYPVISIEFSPLSTVELTTNWYQLHNGDYKGILEHSFGKQLPTTFLQSLLDTYKMLL